MNRAKNYTIEYFLLLFVIAITGFMSFFFMKQLIFYILPIVIYIVYKRHIKYPKSYKIILLIYFGLFLIQVLVHHGPISLAFTQILRFYCLSLITLIVMPSFKYTFPRLMYMIALVSLVLWTLCQVSDGFEQILIRISDFCPELRPADFLERNTNPSKSIYIYTINTENSIRNSGPFWEPGMFTVFITLAMLHNLYSGEKLSSFHNIILLLTNITTFSTTGYVASALLIIGYVFLTQKNKLLKIIVLIFLPFLVVQFLQLDFMQDKIRNDILSADQSYSRFGAILYHWEKIKLSPIVGYGANDWAVTTMDNYIDNDSVSPNGLSIVPVFWGIPMAILFFILLFKSTYALLSTKSVFIHILSFIIILILVFSQDITNREFFYMLTFMGISYFRK